MLDNFIDTFFILIFVIFVTAVATKELVDRNRSVQQELQANNQTDNKSTTKPENLERFIVADAQDFEQYQRWRKFDMSKADDFVPSELDAPQVNSIVNYDRDVDRDKDFGMIVVHGKPKVKPEAQDKAFVTAPDFGWEAPRQQVGCANASISAQFEYGNQPLLPFQIACNQPNKLTSENYYKSHYRPQIIPIEDYYVRGANYQEFNSFMTPYQMRGYSILSANTKGLPPSQNQYQNLPVSENYAFHNTPAMPMP